MSGQEKDCLFNKVFTKDVALIEHLEHHRSQDAHRLLKRLDTVCKHSLPVLKQEVWSEEQIQYLLHKLVKSYIQTADSIKISRAVEKLWQPYVSRYEDYINRCLETHVLAFISAGCSDCQHTARVSVLFEQSKPVQSVIKRNLDKVVQWLSSQLLPLVELRPCNLTQSQAQSLYAVVKICLQLFQVCPRDIGDVMWLKGVSSDLHLRAKLIVQSLLDILRTEGYQTDCVLLCGTAVAIMLNTCQDIHQPPEIFHRLLTYILDNDSTVTAESLWEHEKVARPNIEIVIKLLSEVTISNIGSLALLRGVVACGNMKILIADSNHDNQSKSGSNSETRAENVSSDSLLCQLFPYIHTLCQGDITIHYHSFQILQLWYARVIKLTSAQKSLDLCNFLSSILKSSMNLVILNWDSPVEDVPETVVEVFTSMLVVWETVKNELPGFVHNMLKVLQDTPWFVKGKYRILGALLKYVETDKVLDESGAIQSQLLQCLSTNHLASSATSVYKAFLVKLGNSEESIDKWKSLWLVRLVDGLVSDNSLLRHNTSLHWVPITLKLLPLSCGHIQNHLSSLLATPNAPYSRTRVLHGWIIVAKTTRALTGAADLTASPVRAALYSGDEDVRSDALALVCTTLKKAECLSDTEAALLKECLPYNIKIDSAPFRQHLGSDVRKMLVRLRDSCVTMIKAPDENKNKLDCAVKFVDWLHELCVDYLLPGACYQRRKGSLDLLHVIYECLIYSPDSRQRKGFVPEMAVKLVLYAQSTDRWDFFSHNNTQALVLCVLDSAVEIQSSAFQLLVRYYTWSVKSNVETPNNPSREAMHNQLETPDRMCCHLLAEALRLCNSPKGHESESGAVLCKLVFQKFVVENHCSFHIKHNGTDNSYSVSMVDSGNKKRAAEFLNQLLSEVQRCMTEAEKNLVAASKLFPIYGLVSSVTKCLTETEDICGKLSDTFLSISTQLVNMCRNLIDSMLNIMSGVAGQEACPSFAEIGMALENLLLENETDYSESTSLSPEYQYMLSWCWNNIKESCNSLGEVTRSTVASKTALTLAVIADIRSTFITVLTKCRHKGVIEGCRSAFVRFCLALFQSMDEALTAVPADILTEVLRSLKNKQISSSVTRRSAGLPIIIQAVLVSEKHTKKSVLLSKAVTELFEICRLLLDADLGLTDLPQVHGLNILNSLFSDASLSSSLIGHTGHVTIMVIQQFGSPSWGIRNAATRLFSTMVTKVFGQKKSQDGRFCNSVTFQELSSYYPDLPAFLLTILKEASSRDVSDISQIHPSLFPVLTLLSCLKPTDTLDLEIKKELNMFLDTIKVFTRSPVYQLRHLVAPACVAMVTVTDMTSSVISCLDNDIINRDTNGLSANSIHGHLLFVSSIIDCMKNGDDLRTVWQKLVWKSWLLEYRNGVISGLYIHILLKLLKEGVIKEMIDSLDALILEKCCHDNQMVGCGMLSEAGVKFLFATYQHRGVDCTTLAHRLLSSPNLEARKSCLEYLMANIYVEFGWFNKKMILGYLAIQFTREPYLQNRFLILELIASIYSAHWDFTTSDLDLLNQCLTCAENKIWDYRSRSSLLLIVWAICIRHEADSRRDANNTGKLCRLVQESSGATNETERLSSARALQIAGSYLITPHNGQIAVRLISACLTLIQDEDVDIRAEACKFVTNLLKSKHIVDQEFVSVHSNVCYELFMKYVSETFWWSHECVQYLCDQLCSAGNLEKVVSERCTSRYSQLFDLEDNSFFAEKIYNFFVIHKALQVIVGKCTSTGETSSLSAIQKMDLHNSLKQSLAVLHTTLQNIEEGSVINILSDNSVLACAVGLILYCDIVNMAGKDNPANKLHHGIQEVVMLRKFPPALQKKLDCLPSLDTSR